MLTTRLMELGQSLGTERLVAKGRFVLRQGDCSDRFFVVRQGLLKAFYQTFDGREFTKSFIREHECIASMQVLVAGNPSPFNLMTLEDSRLLEVPGTLLLERIKKDTAATAGLNTLLTELAMKKERREYELLCLSAEERYRRFCDREPALVKRLSQGEVARYLGITPVALSRIRHRSRPDCV